QPESEVAGAEMVNTCFQVRQITAHQVDLEFVQRSGACSGAEVYLTARICLLFCDSGRKIQNSRESLQVGTRLAAFVNSAGGNGRKSCNSGLIRIPWKGYWVNSCIDFQRYRLVLPIKIVRAGLEAPF